ncbi:6,7-dimethyl-8-ribityllumazine synthase [Tistrella mobilis]
MNQISQTTPTTIGQNDEITPRFAVLRARWHADLVDRAVDGFTDRMAERGIPAAAIDVIDLPGAFEIPLEAKRIAEAGRHVAVIAVGFVVDGGIYRHDFVARAVIEGLMRVQLDTGMPVFSVVLTPHHFHEHDVHQAFFTGHMTTKGQEAAEACLATPAVRDRLGDHAARPDATRPDAARPDAAQADAA